MQADTDIAERPAWPEAQRKLSRSKQRQNDGSGSGGDFFKSELPKKLGIMVVSASDPCTFNAEHTR